MPEVKQIKKIRSKNKICLVCMENHEEKGVGISGLAYSAELMGAVPEGYDQMYPSNTAHL